MAPATTAPKLSPIPKIALKIRNNPRNITYFHWNLSTAAYFGAVVFVDCSQRSTVLYQHYAIKIKAPKNENSYPKNRAEGVYWAALAEGMKVSYDFKISSFLSCQETKYIFNLITSSLRWLKLCKEVLKIYWKPYHIQNFNETIKVVSPVFDNDIFTKI